MIFSTFVILSLTPNLSSGSSKDKKSSLLYLSNKLKPLFPELVCIFADKNFDFEDRIFAILN